MDARLRAPAGARRRARLDRAAAAARLEPRRRRHRGVLLPRSRRPLPRDPAFPAGQGRSEVARPGDALFLGLDHTAIVVADTDASLGVLSRHARACSVAGAGENYGVEQEHLNNVFGVRLRITTLRAARGHRRRAARVSRAARRPAGAARSAGQRHRALADHDARRRRRAAAAADRALFSLVSPDVTALDAARARLRARRCSCAIPTATPCRVDPLTRLTFAIAPTHRAAAAIQGTDTAARRGCSHTRRIDDDAPQRRSLLVTRASPESSSLAGFAVASPAPPRRAAHTSKTFSGAKVNDGTVTHTVDQTARTS